MLLLPMTNTVNIAPMKQPMMLDYIQVIAVTHHHHHHRTTPTTPMGQGYHHQSVPTTTHTHYPVVSPSIPCPNTGSTRTIPTPTLGTVSHRRTTTPDPIHNYTHNGSRLGVVDPTVNHHHRTIHHNMVVVGRKVVIDGAVTPVWNGKDHHPPDLIRVTGT